MDMTIFTTEQTPAPAAFTRRPFKKKFGEKKAFLKRKPRKKAPLRKVAETDDRLRLQRYLASFGICSRREAESWIQAGRVKINSNKANLGDRVAENDLVTLDGQPLAAKCPPKVYWIFNKPDMTITARKDDRERHTIFDCTSLKDVPFLVNPVGRLDYRTEGLLILTNDGEMAHKLCHPSYKIPRKYQVLVKGKLEEKQMDQLRKGVKLEDGIARCDIQYVHGQNLGQSRGSFYFVTVYEGRNRLVRRLFDHFKCEVVKLVRYGFGDIRLPEDLRAGDYQQLSSEQIRYLKKSVFS